MLLHDSQHSHWLYGRLEEVAIKRKRCYWAVVPADGNQLGSTFKLNILLLPGIGSRANTAMNSSHIANAFTLAVIFGTTYKP
jgi:hypothetical protein